MILVKAKIMANVSSVVNKDTVNDPRIRSGVNRDNVPVADPSLAYCDLNRDRKLEHHLKLPTAFIELRAPILNAGFQLQDKKLSPINNAGGIVNTPTAAYESLQTLKDKFSQIKNFESVRSLVNPVEVSKSIFVSRGGVKMANLDALFNLTNYKNNVAEKPGTLFQYSDPSFTFVALADAPGGFTQYIRWRNTTAGGIGMSLKAGLAWHKKVLENTGPRFRISEGQDKTGDIKTNWEVLVTELKRLTAKGADLVVADGGEEVKAGDERNQEWINSELIFFETLFALHTVAVGSNYGVKLFGCHLKITQDLIYILCCCFQMVTPIRLASSRPANQEVYLVCQGRFGDGRIEPYRALMKLASKEYTPTKWLTSIFTTTEDLSVFHNYILDFNTASVEAQRVASQNILDYKPGTVVKSQYDLVRMFTIWDIPLGVSTVT